MLDEKDVFLWGEREEEISATEENMEMKVINKIDGENILKKVMSLPEQYKDVILLLLL